METKEPTTIEGNPQPKSAQGEVVVEGRAELVPSTPGQIQPPQPKQIETASNPFFALIDKLSARENFDIKDIGQLLEYQERWENREAQKSFDRAFNAFKKHVPEIERNQKIEYEGKNGKPDTKYAHASLDEICNKIVPLLSEHGIGHSWRPEAPQTAEGIKLGYIRIVCVLRHDDGGTREAGLEGPPDPSGGKNPIQGIGSSVTYLARYTLVMACGIAVKAMDKDGASGSQTNIAEVVCPKCGVSGSIIKGKEQYGGGWVCFKKKGGCGEKFQYLPGEEPKAETFTGRILELTPAKKGGKVAGGKLRIEKCNAMFYIRDHKIYNPIVKITAAERKAIVFTVKAIEHRDSDKTWWEVVEMTPHSKVDPSTPMGSADAQAVADQMGDDGNKASVGAAVEAEQAKKEPPKPAAKQTAAKPAPAPAPNKLPAPLISMQDVIVTGDDNRTKTYKWRRLEGVALAVSPVQKFDGKKSLVNVIIAELGEDVSRPNDEYVPYRLFSCWRTTIHHALGFAHPRKHITFLYSISKRSDEPGYRQTIEELIEADGRYFKDGEQVTRR